MLCRREAPPRALSNGHQDNTRKMAGHRMHLVPLPVTSHTGEPVSRHQGAHARNKTHTHGGPLDVTSEWGQQYTQGAEGQRGRGCETGITGWCVFIMCSLAERDWGKLDKNVLWRNKQLISSSARHNSVSSRNKKIPTESFHFKHYVNLWPWILKPWYFLAKTSIYVVP